MVPNRRFALLLALLDLAALVLAFNLAVEGYLHRPDEHGIVFTPLLAPFTMLVVALYVIDGYRSRTDMISADYTSQHVLALGSTLVATLLLTYALIPEGYPLQQSRVVIALSFFLLTAVTLGYRRLLYQLLLRRRGQRPLIFLGNRISCVLFHEECAKIGLPLPLVFSTNDAREVGEVSGGLKLEPFGDLLARVQHGEFAAEAIVVHESNRELRPDLAEQLVNLYFAGVPTYTLELFHQVYWRKIPLYRINPTWLFQEGFQIAREPVFERLKRLNDVILSSVGLLLGALPAALAALAIKLEGSGPVFFVQTRIGKNHRPFRLIKLRTMRHQQADQPDTADLYTHKNDPRITHVGKFLRATRLDEMPQMWNVIRGDMSLIGPRAEWDRLVQDYGRQIPCYHFRHLVKPGITGWAQVNYPYGESLEDTVRKLEYDLYYIRHFSFVLDAAIVLKTIHIMLFGKGR
ncbi:MAG TPA: exopolysaccharide biosynthesis polyprenyl glycosylphosphotransferase [Opitutaceae bacterium]|nr:exopolysaccharide biosynthesis polyprenyl glycosylphosphotransferase [Opitutaceae bacterium]